jgi:hypothetical protein
MNSQPDFEEARLRAEKVKHQFEDQLMSKANVVGVGVGFKRSRSDWTHEIAIIVMVSQKIPLQLIPHQDRIPSEIDGVPVDVQEVGSFQIQS